MFHKLHSVTVRYNECDSMQALPETERGGGGGEGFRFGRSDHREGGLFR